MKGTEVEKCIDEFGADVYRFCVKLCMNKADAEDLYQQTFLKALEQDWILDWDQNPKALFFSLSYNLWKSEIRKRARRNAAVPGVSLEDGPGEPAHSGSDMEERLYRRELLEETGRVIQSLPEKFRAAVILFYLFDFSVEQIARTIKKPAGTVKSRLFKARKIIKKRLEEAGYEEAV